MTANDIAELPLYHEGRPSKAPTAALILYLYAHAARHHLTTHYGTIVHLTSPPSVSPVPVMPRRNSEMTATLAVHAKGLVKAFGDLRAVDGVDLDIGNTTTTAALAAALLGADPARTVGRGTGMDAAGLQRKRDTVRAALERHGSPLGAREVLEAVGGLELAALAGAGLEATRRRIPVILDGFATTTAALAAVGLAPEAADVLVASHRSAEPGHDLVLSELGLEPLLDLRLRLGEASGALVALPVIEAAGRLHREMATFEEAGVARRP